ncbi:MAG TPA: FAD-dependent monooxygenase, partial [Ktedonobacteraceae bacterium]|nr:FAD-dependent monooxygenase [Ktedonobacteraceae bacterium]
MNKKQKTYNNQHAIVIGASMAGLLAARALSNHFEQVTIIERDQLSEQVEPRKGVPQGRHVHLLLAKGQSIVQEYFPNFYTEFAHDGAVPATTAQIDWFDSGQWKARSPEPIASYSASRPFLETYVRHFLAKKANVRFIDGCEVSKLQAKEDHTRVTGVTLLHHSPQRYEEELDADLVVDAGGRGSRAPQWVTSLGYERVEEASVKIDVGYATRIYRFPSNLSFNWKMLLIYPKAPDETRGGLVLPIEGNRWMVTLTGRLRDYPPDDEVGFLEYARSLPNPTIYDLLQEAEPVSPIMTYKYAASRWRHYEDMSRLPEGFVGLGDAVCSFNPVYGQGMSVAAMEAKLLDTMLRKHFGARGFTKRFQKAAAEIARVPWMLATSQDFLYPATEGERPFGLSVLHWYMGRVNELTATNSFIVQRFYEVLNLLKTPTSLFDPRILAAVLRKEFASRLPKNMKAFTLGSYPSSLF